MKKTGLFEDMIRLSIDLEQALAAV